MLHPRQTFFNLAVSDGFRQVDRNKPGAESIRMLGFSSELCFECWWDSSNDRQGQMCLPSLRCWVSNVCECALFFLFLSISCPFSNSFLRPLALALSISVWSGLVWSGLVWSVCHFLCFSSSIFTQMARENWLAIHDSTFADDTHQLVSRWHFLIA